MKLLTSLLLPVFIGAASAVSDATVYLFQGKEWPNSSNPPSLSPEQARLVVAQRLGTSQYHGLGDASEATISYINKFGGSRGSLFQDAAGDKAAELVMIVEGASSKAAGPLLNAWSSFKPAFTITEAPSMTATKRLVSDLRQQLGLDEQKCNVEDLESAINPLDSTCWNGRSKVILFDIGNEKTGFKIDELMEAQRKFIKFANNEDMNVMVILMAESPRSSHAIKNPYGSYDKAAQNPIVKARREPAEEPMTESPSTISSPKHFSKQVQVANTSSNSSKPIRGVLPACFNSRDACISMTNNCSGRGDCYKKYSNIDSKGGCFTCGCRAQNTTFLFDGTNRTTLTYWGGSACQKKDISAPFWLITIFTVVMVGLVSWGIGLMFSIGEEKLPGVIGAGVPKPGAR